MSKSKLLLFGTGFLLIILSLTDYQLAKLAQTFILHVAPVISYELALSISWLFIATVPLVLFSRSAMQLHKESLIKNWRSLVFLFSIVLIGLFLFVIFHITQYFHTVKSPLIFFIVTPIAEEFLFRGAVYKQLKKMAINPVLGSAVLFGLHHLQYFNFHLTRFAIFQITYTFFLGLLFGMMRQKSKSIYPSLATHIVINAVTLYL